MSDGGVERDGAAVWVRVLLPVRARLGGEARAVSGDASACAYVAAEENPRVMFLCVVAESQCDGRDGRTFVSGR